MNFRNLPEALRERIELSRIRAEHQFRQDEKRLPGYTKPHIPGSPCPWFVRSAQARHLLISRITTEVLEAAHEVCVFAKNGEVKARDIGTIVKIILEWRCSNLCPDPYKSMGDRSYKFLCEVQGSLFASSEWDAHLNEKLEVLQDRVGAVMPAQPNSNPAAAPDRAAQPSGAECVFRHESEGWHIRYGEQTWSGKSKCEGLKLIQTLVRHKHQSFRSDVLLGRELVAFQDDPVSFSAGSVPSTPVLDAKARQQLRERRQQIRKELEDVKALGNTDSEGELTEEFLQICEALKTSPRGRPRQTDSDQEKARKAALGQYTRALTELTKNGLDGLGEHLKESITSGLSFTYRPKTDVDWLT